MFSVVTKLAKGTTHLWWLGYLQWNKIGMVLKSMTPKCSLNNIVVKHSLSCGYGFFQILWKGVNLTSLWHWSTLSLHFRIKKVDPRRHLMINTSNMANLILRIIEWLSRRIMHCMGMYHGQCKANLEAFTINRRNFAIARCQHSCCSWLIV